MLVDTSVLIDVLRGDDRARRLLVHHRTLGPLNASEVSRAEVLAGMRPAEAATTQDLLDALHWHAVDREISTLAGELARQWLPSHRGIDVADFLIAATAHRIGAELLTLNIRHFPMFTTLARPY
ncbi:MAG: VapC toxin family PIN domain ribonuclease [Microbacterium sp.]|uniref:type II toxin-antitoxin system VapC family toxin n=1 Tax=Microbacterium sp. TaxID=51671 RepID=UPI000DB02E59|nr:type II toxin-antitoxin system VapC family toxin [Microbacterium sp.]PZU38675.1 MAG: VapC toxin family PIN domain ribonuclease [Microbacterium sp.]